MERCTHAGDLGEPLGLHLPYSVLQHMAPGLSVACGCIGAREGCAVFVMQSLHAGVGVGIHKGIAWTVRNLRSRHSPVEAAPLS